ncbi:MAG: hypothetical protein N2485_06710 [bacterium]|nr:hypothetical protein [bacterium]
MKYLEAIFNLNQEFNYKSDIINYFSKLGNPVINSTKANLYKLFSFSKDPKDLKTIVFEQDVEIFVKDKTAFLIDFSKSNKIYLLFVYNDFEELKIFEAYKKVFEKFCTNKNIEFEFNVLKTEVELFNPVTELNINDDIIKYISILDTNSYLLLKRIKEVGTSLFRSDLIKVLNVNQEDLNELLSKNFLSNEYVFICKETGRQIIQAANLDILNQSVGIKCFHCGKSIKDERMEEILTLTEVSNYILSDNMVFAEYVYKKLRDTMGEQLYLDLVEVCKNLIYNELSKPIVISFLNEDFKIHNVFFLDIYYSSYKPYAIILVSTNKSLKVLEDYFENKGIKAVLINEINNLDVVIKENIDSFAKEYILNQLDKYSNYFNFRLSDVFDENKIRTDLAVVQE